MSLPRPLPCAFYRTIAGNEPVREWLLELTEDERKLVGTDIKAVQYGWPLGLPLVDSLGDGLWEVRSRLPPESHEQFSLCRMGRSSCCTVLSKRLVQRPIKNSI